MQTVPNAMPTYAKSVFDGNPAIRFATGESYNVGSLNLNIGSIHVFMVAQGLGVGIGGTNGTTRLDTRRKDLSALWILFK